MDIAGIGSDALRLIPVDEPLSDRSGRARERPSTRTGARALRRSWWWERPGPWIPGPSTISRPWPRICRRERLWFHVDGAYGALAMLAPDLAPRLKGIERADSLAFDFHKWGQVPYDAGFVLVRDGVLHRKTFAASAPYLRRELRGLAAGSLAVRFRAGSFTRLPRPEDKWFPEG